METKLFEVRDSGTLVAVVAIRCEPNGVEESYLLARTGYGISTEVQRNYILLGRLAGGSGELTCDVHDWRNRTMFEAHNYIKNNWDSLKTGDVIDVEYILGITRQKKISERLEKFNHESL